MTRKQAKAALQLAQMEYSANESQENKDQLEAVQAAYDSLPASADEETAGDPLATAPTKPTPPAKAPTKPAGPTKPPKAPTKPAELTKAKEPAAPENADATGEGADTDSTTSTESEENAAAGSDPESDLEKKTDD